VESGVPGEKKVRLPPQGFREDEIPNLAAMVVEKCKYIPASKTEKCIKLMHEMLARKARGEGPQGGGSSTLQGGGSSSSASASQGGAGGGSDSGMNQQPGGMQNQQNQYMNRPMSAKQRTRGPAGAGGPGGDIKSKLESHLLNNQQLVEHHQHQQQMQMQQQMQQQMHPQEMQMHQTEQAEFTFNRFLHLPRCSNGKYA
tara:strand:+ start:381 stop:977 length:597 start_codon:yes stop_codon:yes gene_type:complete